MDLTGKLRSPELAGCTVPLTLYFEGEVLKVGLAYIGVNGFVNATVDVYHRPDSAKILELIRNRTNLQFSVKFNPEVRIEAKPADFPKEDGY